MSDSTPYPESQTAPSELRDSDEVGLAPADACDPLIEAIKKDVDRTLLRENQRLTQEERSQKFLDFARFAEEMRKAGEGARKKDPRWGLK